MIKTVDLIIKHLMNYHAVHDELLVDVIRHDDLENECPVRQR